MLFRSVDVDAAVLVTLAVADEEPTGETVASGVAPGVPQPDSSPATASIRDAARTSARDPAAALGPRVAHPW